jgi:negative regulator of replication initiation
MKRFGELLSVSLDATIRRIFGESASELIYSLMKRQAHLKPEEAGKNIEAFHAYVRRLVGSEIAQMILAESLKKLCAEVQREYEQVESHFSLLDVLYEIKFKLLTSSSNEKRPVCN